MRATIERRHEDGAGTEELSRQVRALRQDFRELGRLVGGAARGKVESARHALEEELDQGKRKLGELGTRARDKVRQRPLGAVLAAAGVGALLGLLLRRR